MTYKDAPITPALCGIVDSYIPPEVIKSKWDTITDEILNKECEFIYKKVFQAILISRDCIGPKRISFDLFTVLLKDCYEDEFVKTEEDILKAIFELYWQSKRNSLFWSNTDYESAKFEDLSPCYETIDIWKSQELERVEDAKEKLERWSNAR